jgi:hypothetical protein
MKIYIKIFSITLFGKKHHLFDPVYIKSLCILYTVGGANALWFNFKFAKYNKLT